MRSELFSMFTSSISHKYIIRTKGLPHHISWKHICAYLYLYLTTAEPLDYSHNIFIYITHWALNMRLCKFLFATRIKNLSEKFYLNNKKNGKTQPISFGSIVRMTSLTCTRMHSYRKTDLHEQMNIQLNQPQTRCR